MLTLRPGSQAFLLVSLLAVTGEFPLRSLHLLGNERVLRELVRSGVEIRPYLLPALQKTRGSALRAKEEGYAV